MATGIILLMNYAETAYHFILRKVCGYQEFLHTFLYIEQF